MEESSELRVGAALVVDEFDLDGLHGGHCEDGLAHSRPEAAEKSAVRSEVTLRVHAAFLQLLKRSKPNVKYLW